MCKRGVQIQPVSVDMSTSDPLPPTPELLPTPKLLKSILKKHLVINIEDPHITNVKKWTGGVLPQDIV